MSRHAAFIIALGSSACGSGPEIKKAEKTHEVPPVVAEPVACVPHDTEDFMRTSLEGGVFAFCTPGSDGDQCWRYDLANGTLSRRALIPEAPEVEESDTTSGRRWKYQRSTNRLELCGSDDRCKTVELPAKMVLHGGTSPSASADGTMVVGTLSRGGDGDVPSAYVWDVKSGRQLAKKTIGDDSFLCGGAEFIGNTVLVAVDVCAGPGGQAWLARPKDLAKIADLGPEAFGQYAPTYEPLRGDEYVFLEQGGRSVVVQDVKTGKVLSHVALGPQFAKIEGAEEDGWDVPPVGGEILKAGAVLAVVLGGTAGKLVLFDETARKVEKVHTMPRCAAPQ